MIKYIFLIMIFILYAQDAYSVITITFEKNKQVKTALFDYNDSSILVVEGLSIEKSGEEKEIKVIEDTTEKATIIQMKKHRSVRVAGNQVIIDGNKKVYEYAKAANTFAISKVNEKTVIEIQENSKIIKFTHPETKAVFKILPVNHATMGVPAEIHKMLFTIKKTYSGLVLTENIENLSISRNKNELVINSAYLEYVREHKQNILFPMKNWVLHDGRNFYNKYIVIQKNILAAKSQKIRFFYRLRLAELYIAYGMHNEAASYLFSLARSDENLKQINTNLKNKLYSLLGLTLFLSYKYREAVDFIEKIDPNLLQNDIQREELFFWKETIYELLTRSSYEFGKKDISIKFLENKDSFLPYYGKKLIIRLGFETLHFHIEKKDFKKAQQIIEYLRNKVDDRETQAFLIDYEGQIMENGPKSKKKEIMDKYEDAINISEPLSKAHINAKYHRLMLLHKSDSISTDSTINELLSLIKNWRGDELEFDMSQSLKNLYLEKQDYNSALKTLKEALFYLPSVINPFFYAIEMTSIFKTVFDEKNRVPDIVLASVFYNFSELTPIGNEGIRIMLKASNIIEKLGLIDEAIKVTGNIRKITKDRRLSSSLLIKMIELNLQRKDYKEAINLLDQPKKAFFEIPEEYITKLRVRALQSIKKYKEALDLLKGDNSIYAFNKRSDIYWETKDWQSIIEQGESVLIFRKEPAAILSNLEMLQLQRLATAYVALGEDETFINLHAAFKDLISDPYINLWLRILGIVEQNGDKLRGLNYYVKKIKEILSATDKSVLSGDFLKHLQDVILKNTPQLKVAK